MFAKIKKEVRLGWRIIDIFRGIMKSKIICLNKFKKQLFFLDNSNSTYNLDIPGFDFNLPSLSSSYQIYMVIFIFLLEILYFMLIFDETPV